MPAHRTPTWFDDLLERMDISFYDFIFSFNRAFDTRLNRSEFWEAYWNGDLDEMLNDLRLEVA